MTRICKKNVNRYTDKQIKTKVVSLYLHGTRC